MPTRVKISIKDDPHLRSSLDSLYEEASHASVVAWAMLLATHILDLADERLPPLAEIQEGFALSKAWLSGKANLQALRKAAFAIHALARKEGDSAAEAMLRGVAHALSAAHMKEHAMVASDYTIKVINLLHPHDSKAITEERVWQLEALKSVQGF